MGIVVMSDRDSTKPPEVAVQSWTPWGPSPPEINGGGWAHPGLAITATDRLVTCHPSLPRILVMDLAGRLLEEWPLDGIEGHGITASHHDAGQETLWIADPGFKLTARGPNVAAFGNEGGRVTAWSLSGQKIAELPVPPHRAYTDGLYKPTSVAVADRSGETGDLWVADGYGQSLVHRFSAAGDYLGSLDGGTGAGRFDGPHAISVVRGRRDGPELYVCDRENKRIQVFDLDGRYKRTVGEGFLTSPSGFLSIGDRLLVAELRARLVVLEEDRLVGTIGADDFAPTRAGWPNRVDDAGAIVPVDEIPTGRFNSPHAMSADRSGNLYVTEWLLGGRISKLELAVLGGRAPASTAREV